MRSQAASKRLSLVQVPRTAAGSSLTCEATMCTWLRWKAVPRSRVTSPLYQLASTSRPPGVVHASAEPKAEADPLTSMTTSKRPCVALAAASSGVSASQAPSPLALSRRSRCGSTAERRQLGARMQVTRRPMSPCPKTATRSHARGCASWAMLNAVSTAGRNTASWRSIPLGILRSAPPSGSRQCAEAWGAKQKTLEPTHPAASTPAPTLVTTPARLYPYSIG
mmetsp:Transcript_66098/g.149206  ORF Transcript_66098/g.149206 Transcript_66098/m.149206 type:complete len:223 (-) Transcript_66098:1133-1801(-)